MTSFYAIGITTVRGIACVASKVIVTGLGNLPTTGGLIVTPNHLHFADPPVIGAFLPRKIHYMVKQEAWDAPVLGLLPRWFEAFPVRRGEVDQGAFRMALQLLASGQVVGIFPEGHRSKSGHLQRGRPGAIVLSRRSGAPIVPVGMWGLKEVLTIPGIFLRHTINISVGEPYHTRDAVPGDAAEVTADLMERIGRLLPPEHRGGLTTAHE